MVKFLAISFLILSSYLAVSAFPKNKNLKEGDIKIEALPRSLGENVAYKKWPKGVVPYILSTVYSN